MPNASPLPAEFSGSEIRCIRGERIVFAGLSFAVAAGGALVLSGANGSGKSSLLRVMAGLLPMDTGELRRGGMDVAADPESHQAGLHYVGHLDAIKPVLSVAENLNFWARIHSRSADAAARAGAALETFGLSALADMPARLLSAGQHRRLNLARLIASPAPLWLLDEPTVALDTASVAAMVDCIADHRAGGGAVVVSTHIDLKIDGAAELSMEHYATAGLPS